MVTVSAQLVRDLRDLVAALDRRLPQVERAGEAAIARDAATLRARALTRIQELERESVATKDAEAIEAATGRACRTS